MAVLFGSPLRRVCCFAPIMLPNTGYCSAALWTASVSQPVLRDVVPGAADKQCAAAGATGVRAIAVNVSFIYEMKAGIFRDLPGAVQRFRGCSRFVAELEVWMEGGEVQGDVGPEMSDDPIGEFARIGGIIVQRRNH